MSSLTGQTLGRYLIANRLGQGGMAEVYRANDTKLGRDVAVKVILAMHGVESAHSDRRFDDERFFLEAACEEGVPGSCVKVRSIGDGR